MIQELLAQGSALILGLITAVLGMGATPADEVAVLPPEMPALENWDPGVTPPTLEEVIYDLLNGAGPTVIVAPKPAPSIPTTPFPKPTPTFPTPPVTLPKTPIDEPLPPVADPDIASNTTAKLKGALVNIICIPAKSTGIQGTSGTGVLIDSKGIIVTVAHVGQYFLLQDYPTAGEGNCIIRTGSPAKNAYSAKLIYLSSEWMEENTDIIGSTNPRGTGEYDYALLAITGSLSGGLPSSYPYVRPVSQGDKAVEGADVAIGSYGAEFLTSSQIRSSLYPTITFGEIKEAYTFRGGNIPEIFSVQAGAAAQQGSSGGAVLNDDDRFLGLISTRTVRADLSMRDLQAITFDHIRGSFKKETGQILDSFLQGSPSALVSAFTDEVATLLKKVTDQF